MKGHSTQEMVDEGKVKKEDKEGNDEADDAADKGSIGEQPRIYYLARLHSRRQKAYEDFMSKVHRYIIILRGLKGR